MQGVNSEHSFPNEICAADSRSRGWAENTPSQTKSVQQTLGVGAKTVNSPSQTKSVQQIYEAGGEQWTPLPKQNLCSRFTRQGVNSEHPFPIEICAADSRGSGWAVNTLSQTKSVQQIHEAGGEQWTPLPKRNLCSRFTRQGVNSEHPFPNEICAADSRGRGWIVNTPYQTKSVQQIYEAGGEQLTSLYKRNLCSRFTGQGWTVSTPSQTKFVQQIHGAGGE